MKDSADSVKDFAKAALAEIEKMEQGHIQVSDPISFVKKMLEGVIDPQPARELQVPFYKPPLIPPEFPKLKVLYDAAGNRKEWLIVQNFTEEEMYHAGGWYTRPLAELESLKAEGIQERPLSAHDRARDKFRYANP